MQTRHTKPAMADPVEEEAVRQALHRMELDGSFKTVSSYSANTGLYPTNQIPFTEKHMTYLKVHPQVDPQQYLSNLRLMIKIRS